MEVLNGFGLAISVVFILGYIAIILEHYLKVNKATSALLTAVVMWAIVFASPHVNMDSHLSFLKEELAEITQVVFFLISAIAIVEIVSAHQGFTVVSNLLHVKTKKQFFWAVGLIAFFLSAILDNLTTTIVMVTLVAKVVPNRSDRWIIGSAVVIAANAGGAWTPIGDVTTTMLWIGGQLTADSIIENLFFPSITCLLVSLLLLSRHVKGELEIDPRAKEVEKEPHSRRVLFIGIASLVFIPIFKMLTGLPPFMGALFGLSVLWLYTDVVHSPHQDRDHLRTGQIFRNIDIISVLFFVGILLAVSALNEAGILPLVASWLDKTINSPALIAAVIGLLSAIVDNVPLVAAAMGMYDFTTQPQNSAFWQMIAYCAGTGGSILIIGSAAGVVFMGMEKVDFFWYFRKISFAAFLGYIAGLLVYLSL